MTGTHNPRAIRQKTVLEVKTPPTGKMSAPEVLNTVMDDSLLFDIYEDLSVDKWAKSERADRDSNIDLFTEALAVDTIDLVVNNQLSELRKENEKLRQENTELRESNKQLSKNISSLFLTARREILDKEQKISKFMLERQRENREPCKVITTDKSVETLRSAHKLVSKQPEVKHLSSVRSSSTTNSSEKTPQSEIRDRLMIGQLYSLSSCQPVSSRKRGRNDECDGQPVQNKSSSSVNSETQYTFNDKLKPHCTSASMGREVNENKQDNYQRSNTSTHRYLSSSDDQQPHKSTVDNMTSRKECKSVTHSNKTLKLSEVECQNYVKIRKIETPQTGIIINSQIEESDDSKCKHLDIESCNKQDSLICKSKAVSTPANSSSELAVKPDTASRSARLKCVLEPEKEIRKTFGSLNNNFSEKSFAAFNSTEIAGNQTAQSVKKSVHDTKNDDHAQMFSLSHTNKSRSYIKSTKGCTVNETASAYKNDVKGHSFSNGKIKKESDVINLELGCSPLPYKCPYKMASFVKTTETNSENDMSMTSVSHLSRSSDVTKDDKHRLFRGNDTKEHARHKSFSREFKKLHDKATNFHDSDKNNSESFCHVKPMVHGTDHCKASSVDNNVDSTQHLTYITCTSNLILLGDEETTCTTMASPNKFQPSEFYPPGVRGDVREGGSHVRHIRGLTEVITKVSGDMKYSFQDEQDNASDAYSTAVGETVQIKTRTANLTNTPDVTFLSDLSNCRKKSLKSKRHQLEESSEVRPDKIVRLSHNGTKERDWVCTVNEMFGDVFKKNLHTLKRESEYLTKPEIGNTKRPRSAHNFVNTDTVHLKTVSNTLT